MIKKIKYFLLTSVALGFLQLETSAMEDDKDNNATPTKQVHADITRWIEETDKKITTLENAEQVKREKDDRVHNELTRILEDVEETKNSLDKLHTYTTKFREEIGLRITQDSISIEGILTHLQKQGEDIRALIRDNKAFGATVDWSIRADARITNLEIILNKIHKDDASFEKVMEARLQQQSEDIRALSQETIDLKKTVSALQEKSYGPKGVGGSAFKTVPCRIVKIKLHASVWLDSIELYRHGENGKPESLGRIGGPGGKKTVIKLDENEILTGIHGKAGSVIDSIYFTTNKRRSILGFVGTFDDWQPSSSHFSFPSSSRKEEVISIFGTTSTRLGYDVVASIGIKTIALASKNQGKKKVVNHHHD